MFDAYTSYLACARDIYTTQHTDTVYGLSPDRTIQFINWLPYHLDEIDPTHLADAMILFHYSRKDL